MAGLDSIGQTATLCCVGDVTLSGRTGRALLANIPDGRRRLWGPTADADIVFLNLESAVCPPREPSKDRRFSLRSDPAVVPLLDRRCVAGLANNHIMDFGEAGLRETLEHLDARGIPHAGAGRNLEEAGGPAVVSIRGVDIALLCAADPRYQAAGHHTPGTFPARPELLAGRIRAASASGAFVAVSVHEGLEFSPWPTRRQVRLAELCLEEGARLVCFHHSHCPGVIARTGGGLVLYGLGKYAFPYGDYFGPLWRRWLLREAQRSFAWRVEVVPAPVAPEARPAPLRLAEDGLPVVPATKDARQMQRRLLRLSARAESGIGKGGLPFPASPEFLMNNLRAYLGMLRRRGWRRTWTAAREGVCAQMAGGPPSAVS